MSPKRLSSPAAGKPKPKRIKHTLTLEDKVKILDMVKGGETNSAVGRKFEINESAVRYLKKQEAQIRHAVTTSVGGSAKNAANLRDKVMTRMESALCVWLDDCRGKNVALDSNLIREKALSLHSRYSADHLENPGSSTNPDQKPFTASKGWFDRFRKRFSLKNVKIYGESAAADHEAAAAYPALLKKVIEEKGYKPEQVFNADETAIFWKKMTNRTYISMQEKTASGFKAAKDRFTLLMCGNAAGHMIKPALIYRAANPRALKNRTKSCLPVYWMFNSKAWMTKLLFSDWFHKCFIPEVKRYLRDQGLEFKVLLLLDNAPGHPDAVQLETEGIKILYLPPNTTSLIQPMDQGVIRAFKALYTRRSMQKIVEAMEHNTEFSLSTYWRNFNIADSISILQSAIDELKKETVNACWKNLWPECVNDHKGFSPSDIKTDAVDKILKLARIVGGEGFEDLTADEVDELVESTEDVLTEQEIDEITNSASEEEGDPEESESAATEEEEEGLSLERLAGLMRTIKEVSDNVYAWDTNMQRALKFQHGLEGVLSPYKALFNEKKKEKNQLPITMFFTRRRPAQPAPVPPVPVAEADPDESVTETDPDEPLPDDDPDESLPEDDPDEPSSEPELI